MNLIKKMLLGFRPIRFISYLSVFLGLVIVFVLRFYVLGIWEYSVLVGFGLFCTIWALLVFSCTIRIRCGDMLLTTESPRKIKQVFKRFELIWRWDPEFPNVDLYRNLDEAYKPAVGETIGAQN
jgi:hypothetical protein